MSFFLVHSGLMLIGGGIIFKRIVESDIREEKKADLGLVTLIASLGMSFMFGFIATNASRGSTSNLKS